MGDYAATLERVSTTGQDEKNQWPDIQGYCDTKGYERNPKHRYTLKKSAFKGKQRDVISQIVEAIRDGDVTVVVCWALDRWTREGIGPYFALKTQVEEAGGRIEFALEPSLSELEEAVKAFMAHEESKRKAERVRIGLDAALANGAATTAPPRGYATEGPKREKRFVPTDEGRQFIPAAFKRVADGQSLRDVQRWLASEGFRVSAPGLGAMIRNATYMGMVTNAAGAIIHRCEPLVDAALWQAANRALGDKTRKRRGTTPKAMLAGVLTCESCGAPAYRTHHERGEAAAYYRCSGTPSCGMWPASKVDYTVEKILGKVVLPAPVIAKVLIPGHNWNAEIEAAQYELRHLSSRDLDWETEDSERARLRGEISRLRGLESVPDRWEEKAMGRTYGDEWKPLERSQRGRWLAGYGFRVTVTTGHVTLVMPLGDAFQMPL
jgi:DNA invertase Pin-like site-specific DNA recombinase